MHQKWKEMTGEFSKKSKTNTEKTYEKYGKISYVFWKNSNVFQEISYVFSETSEILSSGCEVWRLWKQKVQNPREGARVTRAWGKTSMKGGKMEQKRPAISSDITRALPSEPQSVIRPL